MVIWITGLSGSGKSTLARYLITNLSSEIRKKTIHLDGDEFREIFSPLGFTLKDRIKNAARVSKIVNLLDENLDALIFVSILSISQKWLDWNRKFIKNYIQIYLDVQLDKLKSRNVRGIYSKRRNIVGLDIPYKRPKNNDFVFKNTFQKNFLKLTNNKLKKIIKIYEKSNAL